MDSIGASIETEQRAKGEALRVKKQLEGEINELEFLSAKLHLFLEKLKRAKPFWMVLNVLNVNSKETLLMHVLQPRMQRRNPRRPWWMPHALPTSLEPSRIMQHLWELPRTLLETNLESLKVVLPMLRMLL